MSEELNKPTLDDWRILRERKWDWHDQNLVVRPYVDALVAEIERLRAALGSRGVPQASLGQAEPMASDFHEPASHAPEPPTVAEERAQRVYHRDAIAAIFKSHQLEELDSAAFKHITEHYQQRISNCRTELGMKIVYTKRWIVLADGSKKRIEGSWRYQPYEQLGPSSDQFRPQKLMF